jgi:hypothetical protein
MGFRQLLRLLKEAAWAPLAVLLVSFPVARMPFAESVYPVLHLLGGAALAFFFRRAVRQLYHGWPPMLSSLVAFSLACTGALAWEVAEFAIDFVFGTTLQEGLLDTMTDLILSCSGAAAWLAVRRGVQDLAPPDAAGNLQTTDRQGSGESAENRTAPYVANG